MNLALIVSLALSWATAPQEAVSDLIAKLDGDEAAHATNSLVLIGEPAVLALIDATKDEDRRYAALDALGMIGDDRAIDVAIAATTDTDEEIRGIAAHALGGFRTSRTLPALIRATKDESSDVRSTAADSLANIGDQNAFEAVAALARDPDASVRRSAIEALDSLDAIRARTIFIELLGDSDVMVRAAAAYATPTVREPAIEAALIRALKDPAPPVRANSLETLGYMGSTASLDAIAACLTDANDRVRLFAAEALARQRDRRAVETLAKFLDGKGNYAGRAAASLGSVRARESLAPLLRHLDAEPILQSSVIDALGELGHPDAIPRLEALAEKSEPGLKARCQEAIETIRSYFADETNSKRRKKGRRR